MDRVEQNIDLDAAIAQLTERQREVALLVAQGYTQEEIGERLGIRQRVVSQHWQVAIGKLRGFLI